MPEKKPLEWSPRSRRNVESIRDHIAADNPVAAQSVLDEIRRTAEGLGGFPMLGHVGQRAGTRELVLPKYPYIIVYRLTAKKIGIVAVTHQSRKTPS
jgi:toxin ParE1/3/4